MANKPSLSQMEGTSTDLLFEYFADPSKLKPEEKQIDIPNRIDERTEDSDIRSHSHRSGRSSKSYSSSSSTSSSTRSSKSRKSEHKPMPVLPNITPPNATPPVRLSGSLIDKTNAFGVEPKPSFFNFLKPQPTPEKPPEQFPSTYVPSYNPADERSVKFKKMELLAKLNDIRRSGRTLTREYSISSEIEDMEMEIRYQTEAENKKQGVTLAKDFLCYTVNALEYLNEKFDPFGLQLKGWSDRVKLNIDNYNDVMGELYEKYKGSGRKIEPEIKLLFMIGFSAVTVHTSKAVTRSMGLEDAVKNNPELLAKLQGSFTNTFEKKFGAAPAPKPESKEDPIAIQREMYRKMMEEKSKAAQNTKPPINNLLNKLKNKIPLNVDTSRLDETTEASPRIRVTKTVDVSDSDTLSEISVSRIRKKRPVIARK